MSTSAHVTPLDAADTTPRHIDHDAFVTLLTRWNEHQELRTATHSVAALASSRRRLDDARLSVRRAA